MSIPNDALNMGKIREVASSDRVEINSKYNAHVAQGDEMVDSRITDHDARFTDIENKGVNVNG